MVLITIILYYDNFDHVFGIAVPEIYAAAVIGKSGYVNIQRKDAKEFYTGKVLKYVFVRKNQKKKDYH